MPKRRVLAFGEYGGATSTICNNLIAELLFMRKCHAAAQSPLRLGPSPGPGSLPRPSKSKFQARERGRVPCSHRIWSLAALHCIPGRRGYSGGEWVCLWFFYLFLGERGQFFFEGNAITFLIPRTALRGFFAVLTTHRGTVFSMYIP
jgi:hypothetical protein